MSRKRKPTLKEKRKATPQKPAGTSKYARKIAIRRKRALALGLPATATYPEIWEAERQSITR